MSSYSPEAYELLMQWECMSLNMRSAILRARYLQKKASNLGREDDLQHQLRQKRINLLYREIGIQMRGMMTSDGIQKSLPEDEPHGIPRRFIDFRISEEAIPALSRQLEQLNQRILTLLISLCTIRL